MSNTRRKSLVELRKDQAKKYKRTMVRLKYSLMADEELNDAIPDLEEEIDEKVRLTGGANIAILGGDVKVTGVETPPES